MQRQSKGVSALVYIPSKCFHEEGTVGKLRHREIKGNVEGLPGDLWERRTQVLRYDFKFLEMPKEVSLVLPTTNSFSASLFS